MMENSVIAREAKQSLVAQRVETALSLNLSGACRNALRNDISTQLCTD